MEELISNVILPSLYLCVVCFQIFQPSLVNDLRKPYRRRYVEKTRVRDNHRTRLHSFSLKPSNAQILCLFALIILQTQCDSLGWKHRETPGDPRKFNGAGRRNQLFFHRHLLALATGPWRQERIFSRLNQTREHAIPCRETFRRSRVTCRSDLHLMRVQGLEYMYKFSLSPFLPSFLYDFKLRSLPLTFRNVK